MILKNTNCTHRPSDSPYLGIGVTQLTHLALDLTARGQSFVLSDQYLSKFFHFVWVIAREVVDVHQLKREKEEKYQQQK